MIFVPYRKIELTTELTAREVELNLLEHIQQSKARNWFFTMTDDYAISGQKAGDLFYIRRRHSNGSNKVKVKISSSNLTAIELIIHPGMWQLVPPLFLIVFLSMLSLLFAGFAFFLPIVIGIFYISAVIRVVFDSWWFENLFKKKVLSGRIIPMDSSLVR